MFINRKDPESERKADDVGRPDELKNRKIEDAKENPPESLSVRDAGVQVYNWASELTTEGKTEDKFYATKFFNLLCFKIQKTKKSLIAISGLQGTGKTRILYEVGRVFRDAVGLKWSRNWEKEALTWSAMLRDYVDALRDEMDTFLDGWGRTGLKSNIVKKLGRNIESSKDLDTSTIEGIIGKGRCNELKKEVLQCFLHEASMFLIDMPDYNKSNVGLMNADIDELQRFWELLNRRETHIMITVQKELVMKHPHFFWGKCDMMTLEPLSADELAEAYRFITDDNQLFNEDALKLLAKLSRGVFRRFKKYIRLTIESNLDTRVPLGPEQVNKAVTEKQLFEDMELELSDIFTDREKRLQAVNIISFLRNNADVNIKTIAENVNLTETITQKIIQKFSLYNYIIIKSGVGKERLVSLQL